MGAKLSRGTRQPPPPPQTDVNVTTATTIAMADAPVITSTPDIASSNKMQYTTALSLYEAACKRDPAVQSFDSTLQLRTTRAVSTLAMAVESRSLSFDSLKEVTGCLLDTNQEVVKIILDCKKDVWKNAELSGLVEEYFDNSLQTLDFCTALEKCLRKARDSQLIINVALLCFEEEEVSNGGDKDKYARTMEELRNFKAAGDPFTEEFFRVFQSVYRQQMVMLEKLQLRKQKLDKKLKSVKAWRKVSSIIFVAALVAVLVCSVAAAAMAAPPVAAALAAASSVPLGSMGKWFDSLWKNYENALKGQRELIDTMQLGTFIAIQDLDGIRVLVEQLENQIDSLIQTADFALRDEEAVKFGIEEIKKKMGVFMKGVEDLEKQVDHCTGDIRRARTVVLRRIINYPN
uniref:UPF0496 protein 1 n=1 Tax=Anthurium amnicola TaxID=1678845 RepID=A0A1D1YHK3_9ARAE